MNRSQELKDLKIASNETASQKKRRDKIWIKRLN